MLQQQLGGGGGGPAGDSAQVDTSEQIYISSLALLKMLKHGEDLKWFVPGPRRTRLKTQTQDFFPFIIHPFPALVHPIQLTYLVHYKTDYLFSQS